MFDQHDDPSAKFAASLTSAEERLRALGLTGRAAYAALCRDLARRLGLPTELWLDGVDAPASAKLEDVPLSSGIDLFGLAYERFFPDVFKGARGQFFTPKPVIDIAVAMARIQPGETVLDPTCGSGSFLAAAWRSGAQVSGVELDPELVALGRLHLALVGAPAEAVTRGDVFRDPPAVPVDVILANPPFSVDVTDGPALAESTLAAGRARVQSDVLFLEAAWRRLRPGGRLVAVLPYSLIANPSFAGVREWVLERFVRLGVIALPEGIFRPFGGAAGRAAVVALQRCPAPPVPWVASRIEDPGFDVRRRSLVATSSTEVSDLIEALAAGTALCVDADRVAWTPQDLCGRESIAADRARVPVTELAPRVPSIARPSDTPDVPYTEIDLGDVDKQTGEVATARVRPGREFKGAKAAFEEGDLLFGRIRPALNNVVVASRPDPASPSTLRGSSEWLRLRAIRQPGFALLALRSVFVREQLRDTGGQTRPRIKGADLDQVEVPLPSLLLREQLDQTVREAHAVRLAARRRLDAVAALYEAWGRGELDDAALSAALVVLSEGR
jgi:SAM-dependent methyltransferase